MNWTGLGAGSAGAGRAIALALGCAALLFASGAVTGWSLSGFVANEPENTEPGQAVRSVHARLVERAHNRMVEQLELDEHQADELKAVLERRAARLRDIHERMRPELEREQRDMEADVAALLNDEQREKWQRILEHRRSVFSPPRGRGGDDERRQRWQRRRERED